MYPEPVKSWAYHGTLFTVIKNSLKPVALMRLSTRVEEHPISKTGLILKQSKRLSNTPLITRHTDK